MTRLRGVARRGRSTYAAVGAWTNDWSGGGRGRSRHFAAVFCLHPYGLDPYGWSDVAALLLLSLLGRLWTLLRPSPLGFLWLGPPISSRERSEGRSPSGSRWLGPLWPVVIQTFASTGCTEHSQHLWLMMIFVFVARPLPENGCRVTYRHVVLTTHVSFSVLRNKGLSSSL